MRLLTEYIFKPILKFVIGTAIAIVKGIAMWTLRQISSFIRFAWPHVLGITLRGFGWAFRIVVIAVIAGFRGLSVIDDIVENAVKDAFTNGFPFLWERPLRFLFSFVVSSVVFITWGVMLFTTVVVIWFGGNYAVDLLLQP